MTCHDMCPKGLNIQIHPISGIWAISAHGPKMDGMGSNHGSGPEGVHIHACTPHWGTWPHMASRGHTGHMGHIYTCMYMHHIEGVCTPPAFYRGLATSWALNGTSGQIAPKSYDGLS